MHRCTWKLSCFQLMAIQLSLLVTILCLYNIFEFSDQLCLSKLEERNAISHLVQSATFGSNRTIYNQRSPHHNTGSSGEYVIPNIVHYVWFHHKYTKPFGFHNMLAVLSAHKRLKPDVIYFHCDREPEGQYWAEVKSLPSVKVIHCDPPRGLFGHKIAKPTYETSDSNIVRVLVVLKYGGIYLDTDVIVVRSMDELRHHQCVLGLEDDYKVCAGVIMGAPNAAFLYLWINYYIEDYKIRTWAYNSGIVPSKLYKRYPDLVHIEPTTMHRPSWNELPMIWGSTSFNWLEKYAVHLWYRKTGLPKSKAPNAVNIKDWPGAFGELARYTLFDEIPLHVNPNITN